MGPPPAISLNMYSCSMPNASPLTSSIALNALSISANASIDISHVVHGQRKFTSSLFRGKISVLDYPFFPAHPVSSLDTMSTPLPEVLVYCLNRPPSSAFRDGILSLNWAVMVAGWSHFEPRDLDGRPVLKSDSVLRIGGLALGLPNAYHNWLCGDDVQYTETEDGFMLTPEFFYGDEEGWEEST